MSKMGKITNPNARRNYEILETYEAGIELVGTEVKSVFHGRVNIREAFCIIKNGEVFVIGMHISPYEFGNRENKEPKRTRKLLLHKKEIEKLNSKIKEKKLTLVPISMYMKRNKIKLEIGLAKGKKLYDKREDIAKKDVKRKLERYLKYE